MQEHQKRVLAEKEELDARLNKLIPFLDTEVFAELDSAEQDRLLRQTTIMMNYSVVLSERIVAFLLDITKK